MSSVLVAEPQIAAARHRARYEALLTNAWVIAAVALFARLAYIAIMRTWAFSADHNHFMFGYETGSIARSIAIGKGFSSPFRNVDTGPTAWIAPLYPYFCALVFKVFGVFSTASAVVILATNCIASAATVVPLYRLADRVFGRASALVTCWTWALVPYFMSWPASWVWEIAFSALFVVLLISFALDLPFGNTRRWIYFGVLGGVAILTNPALLTLMPVAALWAIWRSPLRSTTLRRAGTAAIICIAVVSPWIVRNRVVLGKAVFVRDNFAFEFSLGNFPGGSGMGWKGLHPSENDRVMKEYASKGELGFVAARADFPKTWITQHTAEFAQQSLHRFTAFWDGTSQNWGKFADDIWTPLPFFTLTVLALLGFLLALGNRIGPALLMGISCLLYAWPYYITYPQTRYRHAIEPLLVLLASYFVVELCKCATERIKALKQSPAQS